MFLILYGILLIKFVAAWKKCDESSSCMLLSQCSYYQDILKASPRPSNIIYNQLKEINCGYVGRNPLICCPRSDPTISRGDFKEPPPNIENHPGIDILPKLCGDVEQDKISNGNATGPLDYPWMAILLYQEGRRRSYLCGGTIINDRYILTAAHCITSLPRGNTLLQVRVGEHDLDNDEDCERSSVLTTCADLPQDIDIEETIPHPNYDNVTFRNDIGLIKLSRPIDFTKNNAYPICLPLSKEVLNDSGENRFMKVTGWGITELGAASKALLQADIPIVNNTMCRALYNTSVTTNVSYKQICAGGNESRSCSGDSGGPLFAADLVNGVHHYIQHGVVSFGIGLCSSIRPIPGVFTRVAYYMDWILDQLRP